MKKFCVFCEIAKGEILSDKILESKNFLVILDSNPKVEMHSLVIPKKHFETFLDLPSGLYEEFFETTKKAVELVTKKTGMKAFNLLSNNYPDAGQVVGHLHLHVLPRKKGEKVNLGIYGKKKKIR